MTPLSDALAEMERAAQNPVLLVALDGQLVGA